MLVRWLHRPLTMAWLHGEGRVVGLVSDSILKVNRSVTGHSKGDGGTAGEGGGGKEGEGEEGEEGRRGRKSEGRGDGEEGEGEEEVWYGLEHRPGVMCGVAHLLPRAVQGKVICLGTLLTLAMGKACRGTIRVLSWLQCRRTQSWW